MKTVLVYLLSILVCFALAEVDPTPFKEISLKELGRRTIHRIIEDVSRLTCAHRCKRITECTDVAYHLFPNKHHRGGECIMLTKLGKATCRRGSNGVYYVTGSHSGPYNVAKLCKEQTGQFNGKSNVTEPKLFDPAEYEVNKGDLKYYEAKSQLEYTSCEQAFKRGQRKSGLYFLKNGLGWHFCNMDVLGQCGSGGWSLAMLADGREEDFRYDSSYWEMDDLLNETEALSDPLVISAKYPAFNQLPFTSICLGMKMVGDQTTTSYMKLRVGDTSLMDLFSKDYLQTNNSLSSWKSLIPSPEIQKECVERQGINLEAQAVILRIGITTNDGGCTVKWSDSWIGVGLSEPMWCHENDKRFSAGNELCSPIGKQHIMKPTLSYIYIK